MKNHIGKVKKQVLLAIFIMLIFLVGLNSRIDSGERLQLNTENPLSTKRLYQTRVSPTKKSTIPIVNQLTPNPKVTEINAPINVACVFTVGGLGDKGYNDMVYAGLQKAQADGLCTFDYAEPTDVGQYQGLLEDYGSTGSYDLIVAIGYDQVSAVNATAINYPTQPIVIIDPARVGFLGNVRSVIFEEQEGSFLVGAMAGLMTQTGRVGFIGGMDIPLIRKFWAGYTAGVLYEKNNSFIEVIEDFVGAWDDPVTGKNIAEAMWAEGVDIIYAAAGYSGIGTLESANEQGGGFYAIGVDADQDYLYPGRILCSMMKRVDLAVYNAIKDVYDANWSADVQTLGLAENGVGLSPLTYTKDEIGLVKIQEVNVTVQNKIISGEITVPTNSTNLAQWITDMNIVTKTYTPISPISVTFNNEFKPLFNGSGTINDPYQIEGLYINASSGSLISIWHTTSFFSINNCLLVGLDTATHGIHLMNVSHGTIINNAIIRTVYGIRLEYSDNNTIAANSNFNNRYGILLEFSNNTNNMISYNTLSHNSNDGLLIFWSQSNTIFNNTMHNNDDNGIRLGESSNNNIAYNTVNDNGANGISLSNSNNSIITHNIIYNNSYDGISLYGSTFNNISQNNVSYNNDGIWVVESSDNNRIDDNLVFNQRYNGIALLSSDNNVAERNSAYNNNFNGITIDSSNGSMVMDNIIFGNGESGIVIGGPSVNTHIAVNTVFNNQGWAGIDLGSSIGTIVDTNEVYNHLNGNGITLGFDGMVDSPSDHQIMNNEFYNSRYRGIRVEFSEGNLIAGNSVHHNDEDGIWLWESTNNVLDGNNVHNNTWNGILIEFSSDNLIKDNTVYDNIGGTGIAVRDSTFNTLSNNDIHDNVKTSGDPLGGYGIWLEASEYNNITNNQIYYQSISQDFSSWGIVIYSSYNTITGNTVYNTEFAVEIEGDNNIFSSNTVFDSVNGIFVFGRYSQIISNIVYNNEIGIGITSDHNLISNNAVYNHYDSGIKLFSGQDNRISDNDVHNNAVNGIYLGGGSHTLISGNIIANNSNEGIYLEDSDSNTITRNHFVSGPQANDGGSDNFFILNYWSGWTSPDADGDGIVDNPYSIGDENQDPYPLVSPDTHAITPPVVSNPKSGKVLSGTNTIEWTASVDSLDHSVTYAVYYSSDGGNAWNLLTSGLTTTTYDWDTTTVDDDTTYRIKVVTSCSEGQTNNAISSLFSIQNEEPTITTTTSTTGAVPSIPVPGMTGLMAVLSIVALILLRKVKRKTK